MEPWYVLLKKERDAHLMTQQDLAEKVGTDARTIRTWESGQSFPGKYFRRKLCDFYGKEPKDLGLDEESATQVVRQARAQEHGKSITRGSVGEKDVATPTGPTRVTTETTTGGSTAVDNGLAPERDDPWHLPPPQRGHLHLLQLGGVILVVVIIVAALLGSLYLLTKPANKVVLPPTATSTPGQSQTATDIFFGFDGSTQGWGTSEGDYKLARVSEVGNPVYSGSGSLMVTSALIGSGNAHYPGKEVYTHTEATGYFSAYSLNGKTVTCYVYLPSGLVPGGISPGYIRIFVKDTQFRNDFSDKVMIDSSTIGKWIKLSFVIGAIDNNADSGFDPSQVDAVGVRIDLFSTSLLDYTGPFYVDSVSL